MSESPSPALRIGARAHRGCVREENQDRISRFRSPFGEVFIVADGMGGHEGGAMAAQMLVSGLEEHLKSQPAATPPDQALCAAASGVNSDIYRHAHSGEPKTAKMGATSVMALVDGRRVLIGHAGDSRAYLLRNGRMARLTRDHTVIQRMLDSQMLNEEEAKQHPDASVVTRAFGQKPEIELEVSAPFELRDGDRLLLCSDGLCGYVEDAAIQRVAEMGGDAQAITDALIDLALRAGGEDNVSVQLLALQGSSQATSMPLSSPPAAVAGRVTGFNALQRIQRTAGMGAFLLCAFVAGALIPWRQWLDRGEPERRDGEVTPQAHQRSHRGSGSNTGGTGGRSNEPESRPEAGSGALDEPEKQQEETPGYAGLEVYLLGNDDNLLRLLQPLAKISVLPRPRTFREAGWVYYRDGARDQAVRIVKELNKKFPDKPRRYNMKPWPSGLVQQFPEAPVLVILRDAETASPKADTGKEPSSGPEPGKVAPRLTILLAAGSNAPPIPSGIAEKYPAEWNKPQELPPQKETVWSPGSVYFRPDAAAQAQDLATRLSYTPRPWPADDLAKAFMETNVLVVLQPAEEKKEEKKDESQP